MYSGKRLTKSDKQAINDIVTPYGVVIRSSSCRNCYIDAMMEAYHKASRMEQAQDNPATATATGYRFKFRAPVTVSGRTYSALTPVAIIRQLERHEPALFGVLYKRVPMAAPTGTTPTTATEQEAQQEDAPTESETTPTPYSDTEADDEADIIS